MSVKSSRVLPRTVAKPTSDRPRRSIACAVAGRSGQGTAVKSAGMVALAICRKSVRNAVMARERLRPIRRSPISRYTSTPKNGSVATSSSHDSATPRAARRMTTRTPIATTIAACIVIRKTEDPRRKYIGSHSAALDDLHAPHGLLRDRSGAQRPVGAAGSPYDADCVQCTLAANNGEPRTIPWRMSK